MLRRLIVAVACVAVCCVVAACGGSHPSSKASGTRHATRIIDGGSERLDFAQLNGVHGARCSSSGATHGYATYTCDWTQDGTPESGRWALVAGSLFRVSGGGASGAPPRSAHAATALANAARSTSGKATGRFECFALKPSYRTVNGQKFLTSAAHTFLCAVILSDGKLGLSNGEPVIEKLVWNAEGFIGTDVLDLSASDERTVTSDLEAAADKNASTDTQASTTASSGASSDTSGTVCGTLTYQTTVASVAMQGPSVPSCSAALATAKAFLLDEPANGTGYSNDIGNWDCQAGDYDSQSIFDFECEDDSNQIDVGLASGGLTNLVTMVTDFFELGQLFPADTSASCQITSSTTTQIVLSGAGASSACAVLGNQARTIGGPYWTGTVLPPGEGKP